MKYISARQIQESLRTLEPYNAFFAITFLVLKKANLQIGSMKRLNLDAENRDFLQQHFQIHPKSSFFFRVMRQGSKAKDWLNPDYASSGLQTINTQTFRDALLHETNDNTWGWSNDYVIQLSAKLPRGTVRIPLFHLAVWFYKERPFEDNIERTALVDQFITMVRPQLSSNNTIITEVVIGGMGFNACPVQP